MNNGLFGGLEKILMVSNGVRGLDTFKNIGQQQQTNIDILPLKAAN